MFLIVRFFIYRCKLMKIKPTFDVFFLFLKDVKKNEKIIAYKMESITSTRKNGPHCSDSLDLTLSMSVNVLLLC